MLRDQSAADLPFVKRRSSTKLAHRAKEKAVRGAYVVSIVAGEQAAKRPCDHVVTIFLPGPNRIETANRAVNCGASGILTWLYKANMGDKGVGVEECFGVV